MPLHCTHRRGKKGRRNRPAMGEVTINRSTKHNSKRENIAEIGSGQAAVEGREGHRTVKTQTGPTKEGKTPGTRRRIGQTVRGGFRNVRIGDSGCIGLHGRGASRRREKRGRTGRSNGRFILKKKRWDLAGTRR